MKKFTIAALLCCVCGMNAQNVRLVEEDPFWSYSLYSYFIGEPPEPPLPPLPFTSTESFYWFALGEAELINGKTYNVLYYGRPAAPESRSVMIHGKSFFSMNIGIREENGRILVDYESYKTFLQTMWLDLLSGKPDYVPYKLTDDGEMILYDFNMQVGDKYNSVAGYEDVSVVRTGKVVTDDGLERKLLVLSNGLEIIEGIGCINSSGMFLNYLNPVIDRQPGGYWLDGCYLADFIPYNKQEEPIYSRTLHDVVSDIVGIVPAEMDGCGTVSSPLYDLQGRRVTGTPVPGIYIRGGKKIWVR